MSEQRLLLSVGEPSPLLLRLEIDAEEDSSSDDDDSHIYATKFAKLFAAPLPVFKVQEHVRNFGLEHTRQIRRLPFVETRWPAWLFAVAVLAAARRHSRVLLQDRVRVRLGSGDSFSDWGKRRIGVLRVGVSERPPEYSITLYTVLHIQSATSYSGPL